MCLLCNVFIRTIYVCLFLSFVKINFIGAFHICLMITFIIGKLCILNFDSPPIISLQSHFPSLFTKAFVFSFFSLSFFSPFSLRTLNYVFLNISEVTNGGLYGFKASKTEFCSFINLMAWVCVMDILENLVRPQQPES